MTSTRSGEVQGIRGRVARSCCAGGVEGVIHMSGVFLDHDERKGIAPMPSPTQPGRFWQMRHSGNVDVGSELALETIRAQ